MKTVVAGLLVPLSGSTTTVVFATVLIFVAARICNKKVLPPVSKRLSFYLSIYVFSIKVVILTSQYNSLFRMHPYLYLSPPRLLCSTPFSLLLNSPCPEVKLQTKRNIGSIYNL
jgi:hypothetical protein